MKVILNILCFELFDNAFSFLLKSKKQTQHALSNKPNIIPLDKVIQIKISKLQFIIYEVKDFDKKKMGKKTNWKCKLRFSITWFLTYRINKISECNSVEDDFIWRKRKNRSFEDREITVAELKSFLLQYSLLLDNYFIRSLAYFLYN